MSPAKASGGWVSWFFGLGLLVAVVMFFRHQQIGDGLPPSLCSTLAPAWHLGTYMTEAPHLAASPCQHQQCNAAPLLFWFGTGKALHGPSHSEPCPEQHIARHPRSRSSRCWARRQYGCGRHRSRELLQRLRSSSRHRPRGLAWLHGDLTPLIGRATGHLCAPGGSRSS